MIARMARENSARRTPGIPDIREAIAAGVQAHGAGKILPGEMPISKDTRLDAIRVAPGYTPIEREVVTTSRPSTVYTTEALAKFLGFFSGSQGQPTASFKAAFGAEELIADGVMKESQVKGQTAEKLGELVIALRKQRDAAKVETAR
jgi:hypothetical protein